MFKSLLTNHQKIKFDLRKGMLNLRLLILSDNPILKEILEKRGTRKNDMYYLVNM